MSPLAVDLPGAGDELHRALRPGGAVGLDAAELRLDQVDRGEVVDVDVVGGLGLAVVADQVGERLGLADLQLPRLAAAVEAVQLHRGVGQRPDVARERAREQRDRLRRRASGSRPARGPSPGAAGTGPSPRAGAWPAGRVAGGAAPVGDRLAEGGVVCAQLGGDLLGRRRGLRGAAFAAASANAPRIDRGSSHGDESSRDRASFTASRGTTNTRSRASRSSCAGSRSSRTTGSPTPSRRWASASTSTSPSRSRTATRR